MPRLPELWGRTDPQFPGRFRTTVLKRGKEPSTRDSMTAGTDINVLSAVPVSMTDATEKANTRGDQPVGG